MGPTNVKMTLTNFVDMNPLSTNFIQLFMTSQYAIQRFERSMKIVHTCDFQSMIVIGIVFSFFLKRKEEVTM